MNLRVWLQGLLSAALGGIGTGLTVAIVDPAHFNLTSTKGFEDIALAAAVSALFSVGNYLRQSPLFKQ